MLGPAIHGAMVKRQGGNHQPGRAVRGRSGSTSSGQQIKLWADLLADLDQGEPSISTTASEMAEDVPRGIRTAVNNELARRGCRFRINS